MLNEIVPVPKEIAESGFIQIIGYDPVFGQCQLNYLKRKGEWIGKEYHKDINRTSGFAFRLTGKELKEWRCLLDSNKQKNH